MCRWETHVTNVRRTCWSCWRVGVWSVLHITSCLNYGTGDKEAVHRACIGKAGRWQIGGTTSSPWTGETLPTQGWGSHAIVHTTGWSWRWYGEIGRYVTVATDRDGHSGQSIRRNNVHRPRWGATFMELKGEVDRTPWPTKAQAYWISQDTWRLADRRAALQRAQRESAQEVIQVWWEFQRSLWVDR